MKTPLLPLALLLSLLALSLLAGSAVQRTVSPWVEKLGEASDSALSGDWKGAEDALAAVRTDWEARHTALHLLTAHASLDDAEALLRAAAIHARCRDAESCCETIETLRVLLNGVSEAQRVSARNNF